MESIVSITRKAVIGYDRRVKILLRSIKISESKIRAT